MKYFIILLILCSLCFGYDRERFSPEGTSGYASKFNGVDQYITVDSNDALNLGTGDFSICFWNKITDSPNTYDYFLEKGTVSGYSCGIDHNLNRLVFSVKEFGFPNGPWWLFSIPYLGFNNFTHIAVIKNSIGIYFYVNGNSVEATQEVKEGNPNPSNESDLIIGYNNSYSNYLSGSLDDIRIYKGKALTQEEVTAIYANGVGTKITGSETGLSWGSNCDTGSGNTLFDAKGTLNGSLAGNSSDNMWEPTLKKKCEGVADMNNDCIVNGLDLAILAQHWLEVTE